MVREEVDMTSLSDYMQVVTFMFKNQNFLRPNKFLINFQYKF